MHRTPPGKSLAEKRPDLVEYWSEKNECSPWDIYAGSSSKKYWWVCPIHGEYEMTPYNKGLGQGCKDCGISKRSNSRTYVSYDKSLGYLKLELTKSWSVNNTRDIFTVSPNSHKKYKWVCPVHGEYLSSCASKFRGDRCKKCVDSESRNKQLKPPKGGSLGDLYPTLIPEYSVKNPISPYDIYPSSSIPVIWKCPICHNERVLPCYQRTGTKKGRGCPHCCNNQTSTAEDLLRQSLLPFGASPDSNTKLGKWNVDIYFPESKTVIEYDGSHWHHKPENYERDKRKSLELLEMGYRVVRVRTWSSKYKLETLGICSSGYSEIFIQEPINSKPTEGLVLDILHKVR